MPDTRPPIGFRDPEFPIFETWDAGFKKNRGKIRDSKHHGRRDVEK